MHWVVLANDELKEEFRAQGIAPDVKIDWIGSCNAFSNYPDARAYFDLLYENNEERKNILKQLLPKPVIINSVEHTLAETGFPFIRINSWPGFLKRQVIEASCLPGTDKPLAEKIFSLLNRKTEWTPDVAGFISARVVAMIINEAYFTLAEGVSTKEETDTAMKLGTNYPYGPFEWAEKIGLKNVCSLLNTLSKTEKRYQPALLLEKEAAD